MKAPFKFALVTPGLACGGRRGSTADQAARSRRPLGPGRVSGRKEGRKEGNLAYRTGAPREMASGVTPPRPAALGLSCS